MKKNILFLAAISILGLFAACEKDNINPINGDTDNTDTPVERRTAYLGTFDIVYSYDSISTAGKWVENGFAGEYYPNEEGFWVISPDPSDTAAVIINGYVVYSDDYKSNDTLPMYETRAIFNGQGQLVPSTNVYEAMGLAFTNTYGPILLDAEGNFSVRIEQHVPFMGMDCGYLMQAKGTLRSE